MIGGQVESRAMPIYEYACRSCGHEFETLVRASTVPDCPSCHSTELEKKLSVFATASATEAEPSAGACGTCGNQGGPGSCAFN